MEISEKDKLILDCLNYLLWVHKPRSKRSDAIRDGLQVRILMMLNKKNWTKG